MKKSLLDVLFMSEKRKAVLLLLEDGAKEMDTILNSLKTSRQSLLPQIKILKEHHLVTHYNDTYELTTVGKLIVDAMIPLLNKSEVLDADIDYWGSRNLDFIPSYLLEKISQLRNCEIINPSLTELFTIHKSHNPEYKESPSVYTVTTILYPDFDSILTEMFENNIDFYYIVSQELLDKIRTEYQDEFSKFIKNKSFNMYVYNKEMKFLYFTFDNVHSLISMLKNNGEFDNKFMLCRSQSAVDWTKELFEYYRKDSTPITEI
ncbi:transcriptional regulator [Methanococcoides methylutens]|uniref:Transcriptional regulator n=1 Tax=Methanococcoides methylutens TaxID=2226 RepID=A0A099T2H0_METMT|nr:winged helix-turn-helix domain-containing protein [Methanococcoides methylutens]KGK99312.1 transcriptional regulator [Methanococcoides methylutens]